MPELPLLYHVPPSFFSQVARLGLVEKGVAFRTEIAAAGPPLFETYAPWYMRLNPGGTVPTLVDGDAVVPDSKAILVYADEHYDGPRLIPEDPDARARMHAQIDRLYGISIRELSYGSGRLAKIGVRVNRARLAALRRHLDAQAEMRDVYAAKIADIEGFSTNATNPEHVDRVRADARAALDELDAGLGDRPFLAGPDYSLADVVWTVAVARMRMIGIEPLAGRERLRAWFEQMQARPSFAAADVWAKFEPVKLLKMFLSKMWPFALGLLLILAALIAGLIWIVSR